MPSYITDLSSGGNEILDDNSEWGFVVEDASERESSAGNIMLELKLRIIGPKGEKKGLVFDNLVFVPSAYWKLNQFREATGDKLVDGEEVVLNSEDCIGRSGRLVVLIDSYQGREKNKVDHYIIPGESSKNSSSGTKKNFGEPLDVPF